MSKDKDSIILKYEQDCLSDAESKLTDLHKSNSRQEDELADIRDRIDMLDKKPPSKKWLELKLKKAIRSLDTYSDKISDEEKDTLSYDELFSIAEESLSQRGLDTDSLDYHDLISETELEEITKELNSILPREDKWCKADFIVTFIAAFLGCSADLILSNRKNKFTGQDSKFSARLNELHEKTFAHKSGAPIDYQGKDFGGGYHREKSKGHDLARFVEGIKMFKDGRFEGVRFVDGKKIKVIFDATQKGTPYAQLSTIEAILNYSQHMFADLFSTYSLPFPGYSFFRESNSSVMQTLAADMYQNGFNLKNVLTQSLSTTIIEIVIRIYFGIQSVQKYKDQIEIATDYSNWEAVKPFVSPDHKDKLNEMLLVAHAIVTAENLGKITIKCIATKSLAAVAEINIAEMISVVRYGFSVVKATAARNDEYAKLIFYNRNVSDSWSLIEGVLSEDEISAADNIGELLVI